MEDTITLEVTKENLQEVRRIKLSENNQVKLRIIELKQAKDELQEKLAAVNEELAKLRK